MIRLVVGLGNPGQKYEGTRHNIGFMVAEHLARAHGASFSMHSRFSALVAEWRSDGIQWRALMPQTFMNLSGEAVAAALRFWKLDPSALLVVADDADLVPGSIRLRVRGSDGGHNGIRSVMEHLGTPDFCRLKVGVGRPSEPRRDLADWLLAPFEKTELLWLGQSVNKAACAAETWGREGPAAAMNQHNTRGAAEAKAPPPPPKQNG